MVCVEKGITTAQKSIVVRLVYFVMVFHKQKLGNGEMSKVLLMDLDVNKRRRSFPNLALMKLSAWHKARGDEVFLNFPLSQPDITYASCVFSWNRKYIAYLPEGSIIGGSGFDLKSELPKEIEHIHPDYELYHQVDFSIGFTSRGCHRKCPWCIVPEKEGGITPWASFNEFWNSQHKRIILLDNNFLASPTHIKVLRELIKENVEVDFNQGLDIRLINEDNVALLAQVNSKVLRFAFDKLAYEKELRRGVSLLLDAGVRSRKLSFYVLAGFLNDNSAIERMKILASLNVDVFPMVYRNEEGEVPESSKGTIGKLYRQLDIEGVLWHGSRNNIRKFLRTVGRLP